jgi:hypothetical protein
MSLRRWVVVGALLGACLCLPGCRKPVLKAPLDSAFLASMEGSVVRLDEDEIIITTQNVAGFRVVAVYQDPKAATASAVVHFRYQGEDHLYTIEGVISYERTDAGGLLSPFFEVNDFKVD